MGSTILHIGDTNFFLTYLILYLINFVALSTKIQPRKLNSVFTILVRFGAALPISLIFSSAYSVFGGAVDIIPDIVHIIIIAFLLSLCILPSSLLLSRELMGSMADSEFSASTLRFNRSAYLRHVFLKEQSRKYHMVLLVSMARAIGEFLILFQVLEGRISFDPKSYQSSSEMFLAFSTAISAQDNALLIFVILAAAVFGQVLIAVGTGLFK